MKLATIKEQYDGEKDGFVLLTLPKQNYLVFSGKGFPDPSKAGKEESTYFYGMKVIREIKSILDKVALEKGITSTLPGCIENFWYGEGNEYEFNIDNPDKCYFKITIQIPEKVDTAMLKVALDTFKKKDKLEHEAQFSIQSIDEGSVIQFAHKGGYESLGDSVESFYEEVENRKLIQNGFHHEIYLNEHERPTGNKLRTIIRVPVK